ncbi:MAG: hypothetical protein A4E59_02883 [Syntrophorhabdus sp. PtaB.Bin027]|nr:MAG: hypothetical protein A4E59_02883 [Syntrophorhabdus sp. PtaB.Bin027]
MDEKKLSVDELILGLERKEDFTEEELNIIFNTQANAAKIWLKNHGFIPDVSRATVKADLARFEKDIEGLTIDPTYPGALFWSIAYSGIAAYVLSSKKKESQKRNPKDRQKYIMDKLVKTYKDIWGLMKMGVLERVDLRTILPLKSGLFSENTNPGKPINALATVMALDLVDFHIPKKAASSLVFDFIKLYFPDEKISDEEIIRRNLYRKQYPSSVLNFPVQKGTPKK